MLKGERSNNGISSNLANTPNRRKLRMKGTNFFENKARFLNEATGISFWARATSFKDAKAIEKKLNNLKGGDFELACERIRIIPTDVVLGNTLMQQSVIPTTGSTLDYQHVDSCDLGDVGKSDDVTQSPLETEKELKSMDRVLQNLTMGSLASECPEDIGKSDDVTRSPLEIAEELKSLDIVPQNLTIGNLPSECPGDTGKRDDVTQSPLETAKELKSLDIVPQNLTIVNLPSECSGNCDDVTQSPLETAKELKSLDTTPQNLPIGNLPSESPGLSTSDDTMETFWTACEHCHTQYNLYQRYKNEMVLCKSCKSQFLAAEAISIPTDEVIISWFAKQLLQMGDSSMTANHANNEQEISNKRCLEALLSLEPLKDTLPDMIYEKMEVSITCAEEGQPDLPLDSSIYKNDCMEREFKCNLQDTAMLYSECLNVEDIPMLGTNIYKKAKYQQETK